MPSELKPIVPPVRTSDYQIALGNPFGYFLHRRLGLAHCLHEPEALGEGSWTHKAQELDTFEGREYPEESLKAYADCLSRVCKEKEEAAYGILGLSYEAVLAIKEEELKRAHKALALYSIARTLPVSSTFRGLVPFLNQPHIRVLGRELRLEAVQWGVPVVGILDLLVLNVRSGLVWGIDTKTTTMRAHVRATTCAIEPQTLIYPRLVHENLDLIRSWYPDYEIKGVGGFSHWICERPQIRMSSQDRDFEEYPHTLKSGPRRGQIEIRKKWTSEEPRFENYLNRVRDWFLGSGAYLSESARLQSEPRVEFSTVPWTNIRDREADTRHVITTIDRWRAMDPDPLLFPKNVNSLISKGEPSIFMDFYLTQPSLWPTLMNEHGIIVRHREDLEHGEEES